MRVQLVVFAVLLVGFSAWWTFWVVPRHDARLFRQEAKRLCAEDGGSVIRGQCVLGSQRRARRDEAKP